MKTLFSINKAAELLEKDRQTLVRALRHVKPEGHERGQPRYRKRSPTRSPAIAAPLMSRLIAFARALVSSPTNWSKHTESWTQSVN